jgi:hypothetical protein
LVDINKYIIQTIVCVDFTIIRLYYLSVQTIGCTALQLFSYNHVFVHDRPWGSPYLPRVCGLGGGFILSQYDIETVKALRDRECYRLALDMCIDLYSDLSVTHEVAFKFLSDNGLLTHCYRDFELVQLQDNAEKWQSILNSFDFGGCKNGSND